MAELSLSIPGFPHVVREGLLFRERCEKAIGTSSGVDEMRGSCMPHWYSLRNRADNLDTLLSLCLQSWLRVASSPSPTLIAGDRTKPAGVPMWHNPDLTHTAVPHGCSVPPRHKYSRVELRPKYRRYPSSGPAPPSPSRRERARTNLVKGHSLHVSYFSAVLLDHRIVIPSASFSKRRTSAI